jgi:hypothetical protein
MSDDLKNILSMHVLVVIKRVGAFLFSNLLRCGERRDRGRVDGRDRDRDSTLD